LEGKGDGIRVIGGITSEGRDVPWPIPASPVVWRAVFTPSKKKRKKKKKKEKKG
jgi:hypothetical protein